MAAGFSLAPKHWFPKRPMPLNNQARQPTRIMRINIDVTETLASCRWTGIERVVRRLAGELGNRTASGLVVRYVAAVQGRFHEVNSAGMARLFGTHSSTSKPSSLLIRAANTLLSRIPPLFLWARMTMRAHAVDKSLPRYLEFEEVSIAVGDVVLLLDSYWAGVSSVSAAARARRAGSAVVSVIHDLIPITHPQYMTAFLKLGFPKKLWAALQLSDCAIAVSQHSAEELRRWLGKRLPDLPIGYFHLGSEPSLPGCAVRTGAARCYVMIGTIEPRKGHDVVLDAVERRLTAGHDCSLVIVGSIGWAPDIEARLKKLRNESRIRVVHDADDWALATILQEADALIMASKIEGFGLPIIEAFAQDLPVIASDIAIFREIGGDSIIPFNPNSSDSLIAAMMTFEANPELYRSRARAFVWPSWRDSARRMVAVVEELLKPNFGSL
jgi:glycosyltransferase involved in cell wall biosynthesis